MKKIAILTTDTLHHRYFVNKLIDNDLVFEACFLETAHVSPDFAVGPLFEDAQDEYENDNFFRNTNRELDRVRTINVSTLNSQEAMEEIKSIDFDFGIVFGAGRIHKETIKLFKDGLINVHRGISQDYRGLDSELWASYSKDYDNIGVTIHRVERGLDTGDIASQGKIKLAKNMKLYQLRYYGTLLATEMVAEAIRDYIKGNLQFYTQEKPGKYYSFMPLDLKKVAQTNFNTYCEAFNG